MKKEFYFSLRLSPQEFLPYYQGHIDTIQVMTTQGISIRFPAMHLRKHLHSMGINGKFVLITENNKFLSLIKLSN